MNEKTMPNLRERLRNLEIKIIDLAKMLDISRPTLYKHIESYEANRRDSIEVSLIALFDYIMKNEFINANNVLIYITQNILSIKDDSKGSISLSGNAQKDAFINTLLESSRFDGLVGYLQSCNELLEKETLSDESKAFLQPLSKLYESLGLILQ